MNGQGTYYLYGTSDGGYPTADTGGVDMNTIWGAAPGIYDFPFREYSAAQGRWLSPDPAGLAAVNPADPQSWNRYAYVGNQPLSAIDPLGLSPPADATVYLSWMSFDEWIQETQFDLGGGWGAPVVPHSDAKPDHPYSPGTGSFSGTTATGAGIPTGQGVPPLAPLPGFDLSDPTQRALYTLALAGQEAAFIRDPQFIALWYAAPLAGNGLATYAAPYLAAAAPLFAGAVRSAPSLASYATRTAIEEARVFGATHPGLVQFTREFISGLVPGEPPSGLGGVIATVVQELWSLRF